MVVPSARRTRQVVGQFLPSLIAGAIISASFVRLMPALVPLLPGLWAICFGIGIFASRPYLPRASGWVALFYYAAGVGAAVDGARNRTAARVVGGRNLRRRTTARRLRPVLEPGTARPWRFDYRTSRTTMTGKKKSERDEDKGRFAYEGLERVLHEKARLGIMTSLVTRPEGLLFSELKRLCALTDGNLQPPPRRASRGGPRRSVERI